MLYVTTRSKRDAYTPQRILSEGFCCEDGCYIPLHDPAFSEEDIAALGKKRFSECMADILNLLFHTKLTAWDVEFTTGRYPVRLKQLNQRMIMGELWHNTQWNFTGMVHQLTERIGGETLSKPAREWIRIGVGIAVLFGVYGELMRAGVVSEQQPFDISLVSSDFSEVMSAWYARRWGLPIGNIVCCCNENSEIWNLFSHGQLRTDVPVRKTMLHEADVTLPDNLERLIYGAGGIEAVKEYLEAVRNRNTFYAEGDFLHKLRQGIYIAVVSEPRVKATIPSAYTTSRYVLSGCDALCYAGLMDYRSRTGESRMALILSKIAPVCDLPLISDALNTTQEALKAYFDKQ